MSYDLRGEGGVARSSTDLRMYAEQGWTKPEVTRTIPELACAACAWCSTSVVVSVVIVVRQEWKSKGLLVEGTTADVTTAEGRESLVKLVSHFLSPSD
ncbi:unnamed protein product [Ectocarpus sp. 8 AP-2014]